VFVLFGSKGGKDARDFFKDPLCFNRFSWTCDVYRSFCCHIYEHVIPFLVCYLELQKRRK